MSVKPSVQKSSDFILSSVRQSSLNYTLQETPFSLYITVRKSFSKLKSDIESLDEPEENEKNNLEVKLKAIEEENSLLHQNLKKLENEVKYLKHANATAIDAMKQENDTQQHELENR